MSDTCGAFYLYRMRKIPALWLHILVWFFLAATSMLSDLSNGANSMTVMLLRGTLFYSLYAIVFYTNFYLSARFQKTWSFAVPVATTLLTPFACYFIYYILFVIVMKSTLTDMNWTLYLYYIGNGAIFSISGFIFRIAHDSRLAESRAHQLEKEKAVAESKYLRARLNPHFLFNALNTIYALSLKGSKKLPHVVLQLSGLLRYVLDRSQEMHVPLTEEVNLMDNYISLQKHRLPPDFALKYEKEVTATEVQVIPILFITLVENCFKHGDLTEEGEITIFLKADEKELLFEARNKTDRQPKDSSGIGLNNLRKRLERHYEGRHQLKFETDEDHFAVTMRIEL